MYYISPYVHFPYEQKFLFIRKMNISEHKPGKKKRRKNCAITFEFNGSHSILYSILLCSHIKTQTTGSTDVDNLLESCHVGSIICAEKVSRFNPKFS